MMDDRDPRLERETREAKAIMVLVILATILFAVAGAYDWHATAPRADAETFSNMAQEMFSTYIVAFEVLGFLLLAALIGALFLAHREVKRHG